MHIAPFTSDAACYVCTLQAVIPLAGPHGDSVAMLLPRGTHRCSDGYRRCRIHSFEWCYQNVYTVTVGDLGVVGAA